MNKKKLITLSLSILGLLLSSCASKGNSSTSFVSSLTETGNSLDIYYSSDVRFQALLERGSNLYDYTDEKGNAYLKDGTKVTFNVSDSSEYLSNLKKSINARSSAIDVYILKENELSSFLREGVALDLVNDLGFNNSDFDTQYQGVLDKGRDSNRKIRASCYSLSNGVLVYRTDYAEKVFGTYLTSEIKEYFTVDKLVSTAQLIKEKTSTSTSHVRIFPSTQDLIFPYYQAISKPLVDTAKTFNFDQSLKDYIDLVRNLKDIQSIYSYIKSDSEYLMQEKKSGLTFSFLVNANELYDFELNTLDSTSKRNKEGNGLYGKLKAIPFGLPFKNENYYMLVSPYANNLASAKKLIKGFTTDVYSMSILAQDGKTLVNSYDAIKLASQNQGTFDPFFNEDVLSILGEEALKINNTNYTSYDDKILTYLLSDFNYYFLGTRSYESCLSNFYKDLRNNLQLLTNE